MGILLSIDRLWLLLIFDINWSGVIKLSWSHAEKAKVDNESNASADSVKIKFFIVDN